MIVSIQHMYRQTHARFYYDPNNNSLGSIDGILPSQQHARTTTTTPTTSVDMATNEDATRNGTINSEEASTALSTSTGLDIESGLEEVTTPDGFASSGGI
jgi:hypothetical protein